uniref:Supervillin a n=1 Tax=Cyprinodon variegatus TaxID=28743 RepID=A0A3Q2E4E3_CYPVA
MKFHPSLLPNLVTNRLLEEDTPRYTRASDLYVPLKPPDREPRDRIRSEHQSSIHTESAHTDAAPEQESKAERIARYKAERRRQLAERYGISLDQDPDLDYASRRTRKENESSERRKRGDEGRDVSLSVYSSNTVGGSTPQSRPVSAYDAPRSRVDSFSERERMMNLENQRRAVPPPPTSYMDVTSSFSTKAHAKDAVASLPPSSPKMSRHSSLSSPKHAASPGDAFVEQQAHGVLNRHG